VPNHIYDADRDRARMDRKLVQELERSVALLRKATTLHEVAETLNGIDDPTREALRKLRTKARSAAIHALEQDGKP
jgi:hypothetical protein